MTMSLDRHLTPDDVDVVLDGAMPPAIREHLQACAPCDVLVRSERAVVRQLGHLPRHVPSAGFEDRVMARVLVTPVRTSLATLRAGLFGTRRRAAVAASFGVGLLVALGASVAWSATHQTELLALKQAVAYEGMELLWTSLRALASMVIEQPWYSSLRAALDTPARLGALATIALFAYAGGVFALRRLLAAPLRRVAHERA